MSINREWWWHVEHFFAEDWTRSNGPFLWESYFWMDFLFCPTTKQDRPPKWPDSCFDWYVFYWISSEKRVGGWERGESYLLTRNESWLSVECMERNLGLYFPSAFSSPLWVSSTQLHIILWSDRWLLSHLAVQTLAHFTVRDMKFVVPFRMPYAIS